MPITKPHIAKGIVKHNPTGEFFYTTGGWCYDHTRVGEHPIVLLSSHCSKTHWITRVPLEDFFENYTQLETPLRVDCYSAFRNSKKSELEKLKAREI